MVRCQRSSKCIEYLLFLLVRHCVYRLLQGVSTTIRQAHIFELVDHKKAWYTQACQVIKLYDSLSQEDINALELHKTELGGQEPRTSWRDWWLLNVAVLL
jgi:hypothetical protein